MPEVSFRQPLTASTALQRFRLRLNSTTYMRYFFITVLLAVSAALHAQDRTLRVDYMFTGTAKSSEICLDEMSCFDGWAGRRHNLDSVALKGNGQICMKDIQTGKVLYRQSFSTLFQEWQATEEATRVRKAIETVTGVKPTLETDWTDQDNNADIKDVFSEFKRFKSGFAMNFLIFIYTFQKITASYIANIRTVVF